MRVTETGGTNQEGKASDLKGEESYLLKKTRKVKAHDLIAVHY